MINNLNDLIRALNKLSAYGGLGDWAEEDPSFPLPVLSAMSPSAPVDGNDWQDLMDTLMQIEDCLPDITLLNNAIINQQVQTGLVKGGYKVTALPKGDDQSYPSEYFRFLISGAKFCIPF